MEAINGVTLKDYACACANLAGGMSEEQICKVLGIELPVWKATMDGWNNKMSEFSTDDLAVYSEMFTNPKQGKFANVESGAGTIEDALAKYPEWSDFLKMQAHITVTSENGIDLDLDKEYGISITEYSQLGAHWSAMYKEKVIDVENFDSYAFENEGGPAITPAQEERYRIFTLHTELNNKWNAHFEEMYKDAGAGLSDDIAF